MSTHIDVKHVIVGAQSSSGTPLDNPTPAATPSPVICYYYVIHIKETLTHVNPNQMSIGPLTKSSFATVSENFERSYYHDTPQIPTTPCNTSYYRVEKKITRTSYNYTGQEIGQPKIKTKTSTIYVGNPSNVDHNGICIINIDVDNDSHLDNTYIDDNHSDNTYNHLGIDLNNYTHGSVYPFQSPSAAPFDDFRDNSTLTVAPFDSYYNPMQTTTFSSIPDHYLISIEERATPFNSNDMPTGQSTTETSYAKFSANFEHSYDRGSSISTANSFATSSLIPSYCCVKKEITKTLYKSNPTEQVGPPKTENLTFYVII
nr:4807_t:CDS:1 [Entrophospora candida]